MSVAGHEAEPEPEGDVTSDDPSPRPSPTPAVRQMTDRYTVCVTRGTKFRTVSGRTCIVAIEQVQLKHNSTSDNSDNLTCTVQYN